MHLCRWNVSHLLIVSLHTQEDGVRCEAGQTAFNIWLASQFLRFSVQVIQCLHRLLKLLLVNLPWKEKKIIRPCTEPSVDLDRCVWELSVSVGIYYRFLPFFPSLDKWGSVFSWTGHTSRDCWATFPHWKHLVKLLGCLGQMLCECFRLITGQMHWKQDTHSGNPGGILDGFSFSNGIGTTWKR